MAIVKDDVGDRKIRLLGKTLSVIVTYDRKATYRILITERNVLLAITLCDLNAVRYVFDEHGVVSDILDSSRPSTALEIS